MAWDEGGGVAPLLLAADPPALLLLRLREGAIEVPLGAFSFLAVATLPPDADDTCFGCVGVAPRITSKTTGLVPPVHDLRNASYGTFPPLMPDSGISPALTPARSAWE